MNRLKHRNCKTWKSLGSFYGYPKCCIEKSIRTPGYLTRSSNFKRLFENSPLFGTGFIPCGRCLVLSGQRLKRLVNKINSNRQYRIMRFKPVKLSNRWKRNHIFFKQGLRK